MRPGRFISLEGLDGAGKSTHIEFIARHLRQRGVDLLLTREPGGTPLGEELRGLLLSRAMAADTELLLMYAARVEHVQGLIQPALQAGRWVLSDRFHDASHAYQCGGRGIAAERLAALETWALRGFAPALTLLLDVPAELAAERRAQARPADRFEAEDVEFFRRVRAAYLERAALHPQRIRVIDAARPLADIQTDIARHLDEL